MLASGSGSSSRSNKEWITPRHRDKINAVSFHQLYSVLASASIDATVKIWDWDTEKCERTLKSHTKMTEWFVDMLTEMFNATNSNLLWRSVYQTLECPRQLQEFCYFATPWAFYFKCLLPSWRQVTDFFKPRLHGESMGRVSTRCMNDGRTLLLSIHSIADLLSKISHRLDAFCNTEW